MPGQKEAPLLIGYCIGSTGYVAMFEIADGTSVIIGAVRHQREDDYH